MSEPVFLKVTAEEEGQRLDGYLVDKKILPSRSQIQRLIEEAKIKINGFSSKASYKIKALDTISIEVPEPSESVLRPEDLPIDIVYEDDDVIVVNKSAGMIVHPGAGHKHSTLVNALLFHCKFLSGVGGVMRPGIVHRIDKNVSGLLVVAKNDQAHLTLSAQFKTKAIRRIYKGLMYGRMETQHGSFNLPIGRHPIHRKRMSTHTKRGKPALTIWDVVTAYDQMSLMKISLETGRTHQIRVHFSDAGHPIVGDLTYGGKNRAKHLIDPKLKQAVEKLPALLLHAQTLSFQHPTTQKVMTFEAPLPSYFQTVLGILHE